MSVNYKVLTQTSVLDVVKGVIKRDQSVIIENGRIKQIIPANQDILYPNNAEVFDLHGMTLIPGLCDAHVHVTSWTANIAVLHQSSPNYTAVRSADLLHDMLMRGFTIVRDEGGADFVLAQAIDEGFIVGPTLLFCGKALSQTGGHADQRQPGDNSQTSKSYLGLGTICDGVPAVRKACREEIRKGAHHIKLMLSGGVMFPTDRISNLQFSIDEIKAAVEEAHMAGLYCSGHTYTAEAVNRAINSGVRSLEHCNLIDETSIELFLKHDAYMVPTLSTYEALSDQGVEAGMSESLLDKLFQVRDAGATALSLADQAGVNIVYGTDLLGTMQQYQLNEFTIRSKIQSNLDVIRSATITAADLFNQQGEIGVIADGAFADLLVVDGNPLDDINILTEPDIYLKGIMKRGEFIKNELT